METATNYEIETYVLTKSDILTIDVLNSSNWLVSETLSEVLVSYGTAGTASSSTIEYKKSMLYDNFNILTSVHKFLNYEIVLDYFNDEGVFVTTNLKASTISNETDNEMLRQSVLNIINLPFVDFTYMLKEELTLLPEFAYILNVSKDSKSLPTIILQYPSLGFTDELLTNYEGTVFMIIRYWINLVQTLPINDHFAQLDLSNLTGLCSPEQVKSLINEIPLEYREFVRY